MTDGHKTAQYLAEELAALRLPPLGGRTVLDVGAWDDYYSFEAERQGASRVVALDWFSWSLGMPRTHAYLARCADQGVTPPPLENVPELWSQNLPGKRGFDVAHDTLGSKVEPVIADFMSVDSSSLGRFDVVLFLGVLYH